MELSELDPPRSWAIRGVDGPIPGDGHGARWSRSETATDRG